MSDSPSTRREFFQISLAVIGVRVSKIGVGGGHIDAAAAYSAAAPRTS